MSEIVTMQDIKNGSYSEIDWKRTALKKDGTSYPLKVWQNLESVLIHNNIELKLNVVTKEIETNIGMLSRNSLLTDIYTLNLESFLNMSRDEVANAMIRIAEKNSYNPFVDLIREHENNNYALINDVFSCININDTNEENRDYYFTIFTKWCLNVVKMANNTLQKEYRSHGILVLQGEQGCRKTTFVERLMPIRSLYKGDKTLYPDKTDSIIENTKYILVEWGELDSTLKGEQSKLKQHITSSIDEYRSPYARFSEKYPRVTSYVGTVNKIDFLKDETGSRRFWIIPVLSFDFEKLDKIDKSDFWGAVYSLWKRGDVKDYLEDDEMAKLNEINTGYNYQNDVSYVVEERIRWDMPAEEWEVYGIVDLANLLMVSERKLLRIELEKRGIKYTSHRVKDGKFKKGFKVPRIEAAYN